MRKDTRRYRLLKPIYDRVTGSYREGRRSLSILATLVQRELTTGPAVDIPWRRRLWLWRRGFTSRSDALFDVGEGNYRQFVSDLQHERANDVAGRWASVVNNKLTYYLLFNAFDEHLPDLYGVLDGGDVVRSSPLMASPQRLSDRSDPPLGSDDGNRDSADAVAWIDTYLDANDALVLKPVYGHGGRGVFICRRRADGGYRVNEDPLSDDEFAALVGDLEEYLVWEFVEQAAYAEALFPDAVNTLRVLTMWDYETDEPFVAGAVHRVGTSESAPVDNWSRGGLSAELRDDGTLTSGAQWLPAQGRVDWYERHPDTGERIEGTRVPGWPTVRDRLLTMAAEFPYLPRIGWDVVVTDDGFAVLEVNAHTATRTLQVHRPLLRDPRVRRFYEHHDCL